MKTQLTVRQATIQDAAALVHLNALFNAIHEAPEQLAARLTDPRRVETALLAEWDGQAVGFAGLRLVPSLFYPEPQAELTELFVIETYRRRGVGRALITYAEQLAAQTGAKELHILTGRDNFGAQALYHAMGYEGDDLTLRKTL